MLRYGVHEPVAIRSFDIGCPRYEGRPIPIGPGLALQRRVCSALFPVEGSNWGHRRPTGERPREVVCERYAEGVICVTVGVRGEYRSLI